MIARPAGRQWLNLLKPKAAQIELVDKHMDHPNRIISANPIFQPIGKPRR